MTFLGADSELLPLALQYLLPIKCPLPLFLFTHIVSAFLLIPFNVFSSYYFQALIKPGTALPSR